MAIVNKTPPRLPSELDFVPVTETRTMMQTSFQRLVSRQLVVPTKTGEKVWP